MKMKRAYIITKTNPDFPQATQMRKKTVESYCKQNGYAIIAGTTLTGGSTEDINTGIMERLEQLCPDVLVMHDGNEFGRDSATAFKYINQIRDMGIEVKAVRMEIPDRSMMSVLSAVAAVFQEMDAQFAEEEDCDEDYDEEEELVMRERPTPSADHWNVDRHIAQTADDRRCVIYVRQNPDTCLCDDIPLDEQCKQLCEYAEEQGLTVSDEVRVCERGNDDTSIGLQLLQKIIAENQLNTVLVTSYDVFSDDAVMCGEIVDKLTHSGVTVEPLEECNLRISAADFFQMR